MAESKTAGEVKVKLVVDSNAKAATEDLTKHLRGAGGVAHKLRGSIDTSVRSNLASLRGLAMAGVGLTAATIAAATAGVVGLGYKAAHAFAEADAQIREISGTLMMVDRNSNSFDALYGYAEDIKSEMEQIGIAAGVSSSATVSAFNNIIEHGHKTEEQARELVENMAFAGRSIPGGLGAISMGFEQIELGMVRAKNPLVQLIAATGTLKGSAKEVAKQMQKMSVDKQMELAEQAVGKMSKKMTDVPRNLAQMKEGMGIIVSNTFEAAGKPITRQLESVFGRIHGWAEQNQDLIYEMGSKFGDAIGRGIELVGPMIDELSEAVRDNWDEIKSAFDAIYGPASELFEYIYEHKGEFAKTMADVASAMIKVVSAVAKAVAFIRDMLMAVAKFVGKTAAFVATGGESSKYFAEEDQLKQTRSMQSAIKEKGGLSNEDFEKRRAEYVKTAVDAGMSAPQAFQDFETQYRRAMDEHIAVMKQVEGARDAALNDDAASFASAFNVAKKANDKAAMEYVAKFLQQNASLQNALAKAGPDIFQGGFESLLSTIKGMGDKETYDALKKGAAPKLGINPKMSVTQNFNGPIHVKQDFRDQDPDRVALVFREDLAKHGSNRLQSRFANPFGF